MKHTAGQEYDMQGWKKRVLADLERYRYLKCSTALLAEDLKNMQYSVANKTSDNTYVQMGEKEADKDITGYIEKLENMEKQLKENQRQVRFTEESLNCLLPKDRYIIEIFYLNPKENPVRLVKEKYFVSDSQIYRYIDTALENYHKARYGPVMKN